MTVSAAPLLRLSGVCAGYGGKEILHGVNCEVAPGEIVCLIGPNGAGKSTVLLTVLGYLKPRVGEIEFKGQSITRLETNRIIRQGIAFCPQGRTIFPDMTVAEHLNMGAWTVTDAQRKREARARVLALFPRLAERERQKAKTMSGGERQMLTFGMALMTSPTLILLDEPTIGLAPMVVETIFEAVERINREGVSFLIIEQNAAKALQHSHRGYVLEMGENRYQGAARDLLHDDKVRNLYLGGA